MDSKIRLRKEKELTANEERKMFENDSNFGKTTLIDGRKTNEQSTMKMEKVISMPLSSKCVRKMGLGNQISITIAQDRMKDLVSSVTSKKIINLPSK